MLVPRTLLVGPKGFSEFLSARFPVDGMSFKLFEPILHAKQWIEVKGQTCIDSLGFDVDGPEEVSLPTNVEPVKGNHGELKVVAEPVFFEGPKSVLAVNNFDRMYIARLPANAFESMRKADCGRFCIGADDFY